MDAGTITLRLAEGEEGQFKVFSAKIDRAVERLEALTVLPREVEDILSISARERHKWLKDGRLRSTGTRTIKMRGRAKKVTFHIFDPRHIEDVLDRDLPTLWREEDKQQAAENRRRGAGKAARTRAQKSGNKTASKLNGWDAFEDDGLLR